ncbi:hypothetical protein F5Y09DRAFT_318001 [Xylaria sp. FL1042]|nr:hypothetical protein F5Y09DRAFT_318001 [Xylaria sp. FL1042]
MDSQPEKAYTCKLPSPRGVSFLRPNCPDWAKIDIIGQTILLAELTPHFGSFQNTCRALKLQSNEVESFLLTHLQYQQDRKRGSLIAEQWGREQAVPANMKKDIPQQRPVLISASSIAPACEFLKTMGFQDCVPAVQAQIGRMMTWPPDIDVTDLDISGLDQSDVVFPPPRRQWKYSRYTSSLGNDPRAMVALVGAWRPRDDGTPDTRISFVDVPEGSVAYGPRGPRQLANAGRYYICWSTDTLPHEPYNDFVLARNVSGTRNNQNNRFNSPALQDHRNNNVSNETTQSAPKGSQYIRPEALKTNGKPASMPIDPSANPKNIFGSAVPAAHSIEHPIAVPFHPQTEPQGPQRKLPNPQLQKIWDTWPGEIFQFRLPHGYSILGPQGHVLTFDPPQHERYDELGNPHGIGGTYFVVPRPNISRQANFKMVDLPPQVALRFKTSQRLVIVRNGMVLPRFIEAGVHDWSIREGFLDLYNARGCYDVLQTEGRYNILPGVITNLADQGIGLNHGHDNGQDQEHENKGKGKASNVETSASPITEALKILAPHRNWLDRQEDESKRLEQVAQERARLDARNTRDKVRREILNEEREARKRSLQMRQAQERERVNAVIIEGTSTAQTVQSRRARKKQGSNDQLHSNPSSATPSNPKSGDTQEQQPIDPNAMIDPQILAWGKAPPKRGRVSGGRIRKRTLTNEDGDYKPTRSSTSRPKNRTRGVSDPKTTPVAKGRQTRVAPTEADTETSGPDLASSTRTHQQLSGPARARPRRAAANLRPIGPLLDAIAASNRNGDTSLSLSTLPRMNDEETTSDAVDGEAASGIAKIALRTPRANRLTSAKQPLGYNPDETGNEEEG